MKKQLEQSSRKPAKSLPKKEVSNHVELCNQLTGDTPTDNTAIPETRCFYAPDGSIIMGILLSETEDSFLVGASAKMMMTVDRRVSSEPITAQPVLRLLKSSVRYVVMPQELTAYHYYSFLETFGYKNLPEYFTEERRQYISSIRNDPKYKPTITAKDLEDDTAGDEQGIPGAGKHAFYGPTVSERIH